MSNQNDREFQNALVKVYDEFSVLTFGKNNLDVAEAAELREYVKKRTNLNVAVDRLTPEQRAWKVLYDGLDEQFEKAVGKDTKLNLDKLKEDMNEIDLIKVNVDELVVLGKQIETLFIKQGAGIIVHWEKDKSTYHKVINAMADNMLKSTNQTNEEKLKIANKMQEITQGYKDNLVKPLFEWHNEIHRLLTKAQTIYDSTLFSKLESDIRILKLKNRLDEWLKVCWQLYKIRVMAIKATSNDVNAEEVIPKHVIQKNGDTTGNIDPKEIAETLSAAVVLINEANKQENEVDDAHSKLAEELFGKPESYIDLGENNGNAEEVQTSEQSLKSKKISKPKGIAISLGVVILGLIFVGVEATIFGFVIILFGVAYGLKVILKN